MVVFCEHVLICCVAIIDDVKLACLNVMMVLCDMILWETTLCYTNGVVMVWPVLICCVTMIDDVKLACQNVMMVLCHGNVGTTLCYNYGVFIILC